MKETDKNGNDNSTNLDTPDDGFTSRKRLKDEGAFINITEETRKPTEKSQADDITLVQPPTAPSDSRKSAATSNHVNSVSNVKLPGLKSVLTSNNLQELEISEEQPGALPSMRSLDLGIALMEKLALQKLGRQEKPAQQFQTGLDTSQTTGLNRKSLGSLPNVKDFSENEKVFLLNLVSDMKLELTQQVSHDADSGIGDKQTTADSSLKQLNRSSYPCSECDKKFGRQCDLKYDISLFYFILYSCIICLFSFYLKTLQSSMQRKTNHASQETHGST